VKEAWSAHPGVIRQGITLDGRALVILSLTHIIRPSRNLWIPLIGTNTGQKKTRAVATA
jgi:hypothetical protein